MQEAKAQDSVYIGAGAGAAGAGQQGPAYYRSRTKETEWCL